MAGRTLRDGMDLRVIGLLLLIPLLDIVLLVALAAYVPVTWVVVLVVLTALLGMLLVRAEGRHTLAKIQQKTARGEVPTDELVDGGFLLVAGALFLTPGLVTDLIALLLALPPTRYPIRLLVKKYVVTPFVESKTGGFATGNVYVGGFPGDGGDETIDVGEDEYRNVDSEGRSSSGNAGQPRDDDRDRSNPGDT